MELDLEDLHIIESLINYLLIPDLADIVIDFLGFSSTYNQLIEEYIDYHRLLVREISIELSFELRLIEQVEAEVFRYWNHLDLSDYRPEYYRISFDYCPTLDIQIDINIIGYTWEILDLSEPNYYSDTDL